MCLTFSFPESFFNDDFCLPQVLYRYKWKLMITSSHQITHVHSRIIHNHQELEATQMSTDRWKDKRNTVSTNTGILSSLRKEWVSETYHNVDEPWRHIMLSVINQSLEDTVEKGMATHSRILAWRIPWTKEHGRLQSMGSQRVGHDWATSLISIWGVWGVSLGWILTSLLNINVISNLNFHRFK